MQTVLKHRALNCIIYYLFVIYHQLSINKQSSVINQFISATHRPQFLSESLHILGVSVRLRRLLQFFVELEHDWQLHRQTDVFIDNCSKQLAKSVDTF